MWRVNNYRGPRRELLVCDHLAKVGDVLFDSCDAGRPGGHALVGYAGSILSFGFGEGFEGVLQLLLKRGAGHRGRVSLARLCECGFLNSLDGARQVSQTAFQ
jgi:hypothetical protein